ncbi:unnamed protein product [Polarella glacialis]|uniref:Gamma-glutamylcyclotransferase n=1 Tax=Polarella glacialis TaxID=89957 RepID=A0A813IUA0_POLGL|nr:unnamed protein product [Polarella glacialis]
MPPLAAPLSWPPTSSALNFAFGANLDEGTRSRRGLAPSRLLPAKVPGWELTFSLRGVPYLEPGFAALRRTEAPTGGASEVCSHGLCLDLDSEGWLRLLQTEGVFSLQEAGDLRSRRASLEEVLERAQELRKPPGEARPSGYRLAPVEAETYGSGKVTAYALASADEGPLPAHPPSVRYWRLLRDGARRHGLDRDYRDFLSSLPRYAPSPLAPVALPSLLPGFLASLAGMASAAQGRRRRRDGKYRSTADAAEQEDDEVWPELVGAASAARGQLVAGPPASDKVWAAFCSTPRSLLLGRLERMVGQDGPGPRLQ